MNPSNSSRFTDEFKGEVVRYFQTKGKNLATTARKFGVSSKTISNWNRGIYFRAPVTGPIPLAGWRLSSSDADRKIILLESAVELLRLYPGVADVLSRLFDLLYRAEVTKHETNGELSARFCEPEKIEAAS